MCTALAILAQVCNPPAQTRLHTCAARCLPPTRPAISPPQPRCRRLTAWAAVSRSCCYARSCRQPLSSPPSTSRHPSAAAATPPPPPVPHLEPRNFCFSAAGPVDPQEHNVRQFNSHSTRHQSPIPAPTSDITGTGIKQISPRLLSTPAPAHELTRVDS